MARRTSSRVISRFLPATATTPRLLNPLMCVPDSDDVGVVDLDARREFGVLDGLPDRLDRGLLVHHGAAADALRLGHAQPDDLDLAIAHDLADDGRHLRRPEVEPDQVPLFSSHDSLHATAVSPAPALRAGPRRSGIDRVAGAAARRAATADVDALAEAHDPRNRCPAPAPEAPPAGRRTSRAARRTASRRGARRPGRRRESRARRARWPDVDLRHPPREVGPRAQLGHQPRDQLAPRAVDLRRRRHAASAISPSMIGRSQSAYRGPYSSMTVPAASTETGSSPARAMPIGTRSRISTSIVPGSRRRSVASATQAEANSRARQLLEVGRQQALRRSSRRAGRRPRRRARAGCRARGCAAPQPRRFDSGRRGPVAGAREQARQHHHLARRASSGRARGCRRLVGEHLAAAEAAIGRRGDGHVSPALLPRLPRAASTRWPDGADRAGAQRDDGVARPRQRPRRRPTASSTVLRQVQAAREVAADGAGERLDGHAGNRVLAGRRRCPRARARRPCASAGPKRSISRAVRE